MTRAIGVLVAALAVGCIKAPPIVVVDRATALEQQAGGSFADVENHLARGAVAGGPVPLTPDQLEALGMKPRPIVDDTELTDADRVDALIVQHCVGEGRDGLLVDTYDDCVGAADRAAAVALIDRVNRARVQLFRWMQRERPDAPPTEIRKAWREAHLRGVVCGGWVQRDDGKWEVKRCR